MKQDFQLRNRFLALKSATHADWSSIAVFLATGIILILAFIIRSKGIPFGFPLFTHPDEHLIVDNARRIIRERNLHPGFFSYPSLYIYLQGLLYCAIYLIGKLFYVYDHFSDVRLQTIYFSGRLLTVVLSTLTIYLTYLIGHILFGKKTAFFSILFISFSSLHVINSYSITVDSPMTFWASLSFLMSVLIYSRGPKTFYYFLNGIFIGFAIGTKYLAIWIAIPLLVAHVINCRSQGIRLIDTRLLFGLFMIPVAFFISTPYSILDIRGFLRGVFYQYNHYSGGHPGYDSEIVSYGYYAYVLFKDYGYGAIPLILSGIGCFLLFLRNKTKFTFLICYPFIYFLFVGAFRVHWDRNIVTLVPFLALASGYTVSTIIETLQGHKQMSGPLVRGLAYFLILIFLSLGIYDQAHASLYQIRRMNLPDTRLLATRWIEKNIPTCARIGREYLTPELNGTHSQVKDLGYSGIIKVVLEEYDILFTSSADYSRFQEHSTEAKQYKQIFDSNKLVKEFIPDNVHTTGHTVRIYETSWSNQECLSQGSN